MVPETPTGIDAASASAPAPAEPAKPAPAVTASGAPKMPSAAKLAAARKARKDAGERSEIKVGTVAGLPDGWVAAKLDPALDEGRKAVLRARWESKGWTKLDGLHAVAGYPLPVEVWVKTSTDYAADADSRAEKIRTLARQGLMIATV